MIEQSIERLRAYNKWRTGEDDRTMDEVGIQPRPEKMTARWMKSESNLAN